MASIIAMIVMAIRKGSFVWAMYLNKGDYRGLVQIQTRPIMRTNVMTGYKVMAEVSGEMRTIIRYDWNKKELKIMSTINI